eukprot:gnl/TRDRNA2_/TRDRNA2_174404_c0_seq1.p1 gnl/TRDRNA2_/TRDRNA2_174404_c0~~gnl/TRDRNA2_/TRDRNA2_174404_c0_seq1.p1  ORF type:complete len:960 (-),score=186.57 gnl/TRDRNA2_/TRDRNA2_174404_c0_seq1:88-2784(-)
MLPEHLANEAKQCHVIVLWLDCDREGENICYEVLESVLPNLAPHPRLRHQGPITWDLKEDNFGQDQRVWRAKFSSLAPVELIAAFRELKKPNPREAQSVDARAEIDLKVGVSLTRLITSSLRGLVDDLAPSREENKKGPMISYGPCQTPTLAFCVQRWDNIQRFNKEVSFTIDVSIRPSFSGEEVKLSWKRPHEVDNQPQQDQDWPSVSQDEWGWPVVVSGKGKGTGKGTDGGKGSGGKGPSQPHYSRDQLEGMIAGLAPGTPAVVSWRTCEERRVERPVALNTVAMLQAVSRELGMDPQRCMQVAEKLYLGGLLTYPRTETTRYPNSMDFAASIGEHSAHQKWGQWCQRLLQGQLQQPLPGQDMGDHPPLMPVWCADDGQVHQVAGPEGVKLYELVVRYFLASVSPDVCYRHHEVHFQVGSLSFMLRGSEVHDWGFQRICRGAAKHDPALAEKAQLSGAALAVARAARQGVNHPVSSLSVRQVESSPPELLAEADLLGLMEKQGIGTDASMPTHVHNIVVRGYTEVLEPGRRMRPTMLGCALVHGLRHVDPELVKPAVRARIEREVTDIARGRRTFADVVASALATFREKFRWVREGMPKIVEEFEWKRKKWRQWQEHDKDFAQRKGDGKIGGKGGSGKGDSKSNSKGDSNGSWQSNASSTWKGDSKGWSNNTWSHGSLGGGASAATATWTGAGWGKNEGTGTSWAQSHEHEGSKGLGKNAKGVVSGAGGWAQAQGWASAVGKGASKGEAAGSSWAARDRSRSPHRKGQPATGRGPALPAQALPSPQVAASKALPPPKTPGMSPRPPKTPPPKAIVQMPQNPKFAPAPKAAGGARPPQPKWATGLGASAKAPGAAAATAPGPKAPGGEWTPAPWAPVKAPQARGRSRSPRRGGSKGY